MPTRLVSIPTSGRCDNIRLAPVKTQNSHLNQEDDNSGMYRCMITRIFFAVQSLGQNGLRFLSTYAQIDIILSTRPSCI